MLKLPFLTDLDSRAAVKGTRDALGIQVLWTRLGRHVVGNLTTVSTSIRDFTTTLLGYYFAERMADEGEGSDLTTFLKFEQLAGYARAHVNGDFAIRGTDRVKKRLAESRKVTLSEDQAHQILGNQKIYGLWGLYTVPSRASGLLTDAPVRLTLPARELVETLYLPRLAKASGRDARGIVEMLRPGRTTLDLDGKHRSVAEGVASVLSPRLAPQEVDVYRRHLVHGGPEDSTSGRQRQLAALLDATDDATFSWSPGTITNLAKQARKVSENGDELARYLTRICVAEQVFAPTAALFTYLLGTNGHALGAVTSRIRQHWGESLRTIDVDAFRELRDEIGEGDRTTGDRWVAIAEGLAEGEYHTAIRVMAELNLAVMRGRGGDAWFVFRGDRIEVRYLDERGELPARKDLPHLMRFPYFLPSLRIVMRACGGSGVRS